MALNAKLADNPSGATVASTCVYAVGGTGGTARSTSASVASFGTVPGGPPPGTTSSDDGRYVRVTVTVAGTAT